jgi:hypothetical protein
VNLAAGDDGNALVEQIRQPAKNSRFRLSAQTQQDEIVPRQDRVDQLGDDGFVEADDAGEKFFASLQLPDEILANFLLHRP